MILPRKTQESRSLIRIVFIGRKRVAGDNAPRRRTPWDSVVWIGDSRAFDFRFSIVSVDVAEQRYELDVRVIPCVNPIVIQSRISLSSRSTLSQSPYERSKHFRLSCLLDRNNQDGGVLASVIGILLSEMNLHLESRLTEFDGRFEREQGFLSSWFSNPIRINRQSLLTRWSRSGRRTVV